MATCYIAMLPLHQGSYLDQFIHKSQSVFFAVFPEPRFEDIDGEERKERLAERPTDSWFSSPARHAGDQIVQEHPIANLYNRALIKGKWKPGRMCQFSQL